MLRDIQRTRREAIAELGNEEYVDKMDDYRIRAGYDRDKGFWKDARIIHGKEDFDEYTWQVV